MLSLYSQLVSEIQISHLRQRFSALCGGCQPPSSVHVWLQSTPPLAGLAHDRLPSPIVPLVPLQRPRLGRASKAPPESSPVNKVAAKSAARGSIWGRLGSETPALTDTSIIRQDPAKETSDHAEVGLGLGWHRVQSPRPTREGQKWSEGHSDVVRMQQKAVLLAIPATANPSRRGIASRITASLCPIETATPLIHCRPLDSSSIFDLLKIVIVSSTSYTLLCYSACKVHLPACKCSDASTEEQGMHRSH